MFGHSDSTCLGAELIKRRLEVAAAEDGGVAGAVRDRSPAHAVLASAAAPVAFLQPAGFPSWVGSVVVGQLETTHHRRAARSRHQLLQTLHKNSWAFSSYVVCPYNSKDERTPEPAVLRISSVFGSEPAPKASPLCPARQGS